MYKGVGSLMKEYWQCLILDIVGGFVILEKLVRKLRM